MKHWTPRLVRGVSHFGRLREGRVMWTAILALLVGLQGAAAVSAPAHGGGCRKSSPPGQCCHMDRKRGEVHCH
ncbi:hypothetical protein LAZ29_05765 [Cereibacter sphaeroides]|uniref:hypothetical protein n=1 Tax=Cereibacter sphaeroides TaxID=1063 RepID=UPI001F3FE3CA|nr:hypothetical protein [Cereibacter sphaeroides]MCE6950427.1 hypothetical protein [Cereibacter sphaeroides]